ncbi:MAG: hypothetical protein ACRD2Y_01615 [Terriglobales bacterium]
MTRVAAAFLLLPVFLQPPARAAAQESSTASRDPQAVSVIAQGVQAMGGSPPSDSVAEGTVELVAGSKNEAGRVRVRTRGLEQSAEQITTTDQDRELIYSGQRASEKQEGTAKRVSMERAASSQASCFPLVLLAAALNNPNAAFEYVGTEAVEGAPVHHVLIWNTFASTPELTHLAEFSRKDLWLDAASGLPMKLAYEQRQAGGAADRIRVEVFFADYRSVGGVLYPFLIRKSLNGTPWATIRIQSVALNTGLSDSDFAVQ